MQFFINFFRVYAQEAKNNTPQNFWDFIPIIPVSLLLLFIIAGVLFYVFYFKKRAGKPTNLVSNILNQKVVNAPPSISTTLSPKPISKASVQPMGMKTTSSMLPPIPKSPMGKSYSYSPPAQNLLNPEKPTFFRSTKFLVAVFAFLLIAIPTLIYFGVKRQQSITGMAGSGCDVNCGGRTIQDCYSNAGSGCNWRGDPYSGSCYCSRSSPNPTPIPTSPPGGGGGEKCCSGTVDCPSGQQCVSGNATCEAQGKGVCRQQPGNLPGCCDGPQDCAPWETCDSGNSACLSGKSCKSHAGCNLDSDCPEGSRCINHSCTGGSVGGIGCSVGSGGVTFTNNSSSSDSRSVSGQWCQSSRGSQEECDSADAALECRNGGGFTVDSGTLEPGKSVTKSVGQASCGIWQIDTSECGTAHGCSWSDNCDSQPSIAPTSPPAGQCRDVRVYDASGNKIVDYTSIKPGQTVRFTVAGTDSGFDRGRFRINGRVWLPSSEGTSQTNSQGEFYLDYPIPKDTLTVKVEAMVHHQSLGWK